MRVCTNKHQVTVLMKSFDSSPSEGTRLAVDPFQTWPTPKPGLSSQARYRPSRYRTAFVVTETEHPTTHMPPSPLPLALSEVTFRQILASKRALDKSNLKRRQALGNDPIRQTGHALDRDDAQYRAKLVRVPPLRGL